MIAPTGIGSCRFDLRGVQQIQIGKPFRHRNHDLIRTVLPGVSTAELNGALADAELHARQGLLTAGEGPPMIVLAVRRALIESRVEMRAQFQRGQCTPR